MRNTGKRIWLLLAGYAVSAAGVLAVPAYAADLASPVTMAAAVQVETPATSMALSPVAAAMDLMRSGRSADALALLEPAMGKLRSAAKSGARPYCQHDGSAARGVRVLDADLCDALYLRAFAFTELGRRADAVEALEQLTQLSPDYPRYFVELAYAYRASGDKAGAMETYRHAAELASAPGQQKYRAAALRGIGNLLVDKGDLEGGEKAYRDSLSDDPQNKIALGELQYIARKRAASEQKGG
ncbi:tetratricopeptide repeat protein [Novosphingobium sp. KACC 22771]|uniref:tetratricopeptide repeat protein n=1 Tax=Novosphingobium sp. KACC 22771 TaxID=3025670 RepID=UPI002365EB2C|nr:tetratricopeptide repeat protein [Novosphingobium sp. KACC 22771]WDF71095.1 tetratricopeptide repeat protein [Novosphingobium sp. KACC 22771]